MRMRMNMKVEFASMPTAISTRTPRFSWEVPLTGRGRSQSAYQILVATAADLLVPDLADLWNSGKVASSQSVNVPYDGVELASNTDCFWKVRVWDEADSPADFSQAALFGTALFDESDWKGKWIGLGDPNEPVCNHEALLRELAATQETAANSADGADCEQYEKLASEVAVLEPDLRSPLLRKEFAVAGPIKRARAFVCGLGLYELRINGAKVGDDVLAPARTEFRKRALYATHDVTAQLRAGENAVGLILGNGWFNGQKKYWKWQMPWYGSPRAIVQIVIEREDGESQCIVSDESWQGDWGPIIFNCLYDGEDYDARAEQDGWDHPGFDASAWRQVSVVPSSGGALTPATHEADKVVETFQPVSMRESDPGVYVYDFGRNMTGWVRLRIVGGISGGTVKLRFAEQIHDDGTLNPATAGGARQADNYIMKGADEEVHEPRFTYHGFQYVELTGYPGTPNLDTVEACFAHADVARTGEFECGHDLINKIHRCTVQSQLCNIQMGVVTDDTQRAERLGWCGDIWAMANESYYNLWMPRIYAKWIDDCRDQQDELGMIGFITPLPVPDEDLVWSAAFVMVLWMQYLHCGDVRLLQQSYPALQRYISYLEATGTRTISTFPSEDHLANRLRWRCGKEDRFPAEADRGHLQIARFGDHLATSEGASGFGKNQPLSIATAFYYLDVATMARIAEVLGKDGDATKYHLLAGKIKDAFNERFFDPNWGYYDVGCQSAQAWPLSFGLVPEEHRQRVSGYLCSNVDFRQRRLTTGYVGTKSAIHAMALAGRNDAVWHRAVATDYPSWGYMLRDPNRTTITENWHGAASLCHTALGAAIDEWFYWGLAGIQPDETGPGYDKIIFKPYLPPDLPWARASVRTMRGTIVSAWRRHGKTASLTITIPANSTATVHIPAGNVEQIAECGVSCIQAEGVALVRSENGETVFAVGSGTYHFAFPAPEGD